MWKKLNLAGARNWLRSGKLGWLGTALSRRILFGLAMVGVAVFAFCMGRNGTSSAQAQSAVVFDSPTSRASTDYNQRVVAYIYDNIEITRQELGEFLIARVGAEKLDFLVKNRIVDLACRSKGIQVTDAEIKAQYYRDINDMKQFGVDSEDAFAKVILQRFKKTPYEWKEDVIRPRLAAEKMVRPVVTVSDADLRKAFEARYGEKVECRLIVLEKYDRHKEEVWKKVSASKEAFVEHARKQFLTQLGAHEGRVPPIHRHFGDATMEKTAFSLKDGEVSGLMGMPDGTWVIMRRECLIPADTTKTIDAVRQDLYRELMELKVQQEVQKTLATLWQQARPNLLLEREIRRQDIERAINPQAVPPVPNTSRAPEAAPPLTPPGSNP